MPPQRGADRDGQPLQRAQLAAGALQTGERGAHRVGRRGRGAEIQRALPAVVAVAERIVRAATPAAGLPPRGDDGSLAAEQLGASGQQPASAGGALETRRRLVAGGDCRPGRVVNRIHLFRLACVRRRRLGRELDGYDVGVGAGQLAGRLEAPRPKPRPLGFELVQPGQDVAGLELGVGQPQRAFDDPLARLGRGEPAAGQVVGPPFDAERVAGIGQVAVEPHARELEVVEDFEPHEMHDRQAGDACDAGRGAGDELDVRRVNDVERGLLQVGRPAVELGADGEPVRSGGVEGLGGGVAGLGGDLGGARTWRHVQVSQRARGAGRASGRWRVYWYTNAAGGQKRVRNRQGKRAGGEGGERRWM